MDITLGNELSQQSIGFNMSGKHITDKQFIDFKNASRTMSVAEAAKLVGISTSTGYRIRSSGVYPSQRSPSQPRQSEKTKILEDLHDDVMFPMLEYNRDRPAQEIMDVIFKKYPNLCHPRTLKRHIEEERKVMGMMFKFKDDVEPKS